MELSLAEEELILKRTLRHATGETFSSVVFPIDSDMGLVGSS